MTTEKEEEKEGIEADRKKKRRTTTKTRTSWRKERIQKKTDKKGSDVKRKNFFKSKLYTQAVDDVMLVTISFILE